MSRGSEAAVPTVTPFKLTAIHRGGRMEFLRELLLFLKVRKKFWLLPIIIVMLVFGGLIILAQGSAVAPFIYTLF